MTIVDPGNGNLRMNPLKWPRNQQIALVLTMVVGAILGLIVGYIVYAVRSGVDGATSFGRWLDYPLRRNGFWWAITGALVGAATAYVRRQTSN